MEVSEFEIFLFKLYPSHYVIYSPILLLEIIFVKVIYAGVVICDHYFNY